jgi:hypothetical protein
MTTGPAGNVLRFLENTRQVTEGPAKQVFEFVERARQAADGPYRNMINRIERARIAIEGPTRQVNEAYQRLSRLLEGYDIERILEQARTIGEQLEVATRESLPVNWRELSLDDAEEIEALVREQGVPLVWVPGAELTAKLVGETTGSGAMLILLANQEAVLADVEQALNEVTDPDFALLVEKAQKAIAALRDDHGDAAQALAAAVFTAALEPGLELAELKEVRDEAEKQDPDQATFATYRGTLVLQLAARYVQGRGYEMPGFNRSTTLHRIEKEQYCPEHNLAAVMAAAAVLRESQAQRDEASQAQV